MNRLIAGELIKVRTTRTALGFAAAALLLVLASVLVSILAGHPDTIADKRDSLNFGNSISFVLLLLGAVGATGEFRHRTLAPAVLIAPDRLRLFTARTAAYALTALAVAVLMAVVTLAIGIPLLGGESGPDLAGGDYVRIAAGGLIVTALSGALGVGVGTLVRNQVFAVVGIIVWTTIAEPLITLADDGLTNYTLSSATTRVGAGGDADMAFLPAVLILVAWTAVFCVAAALVDRRRDVE